jgi:hypothetical protein
MTITFLREFGVGLWLTCPLWLSLALGITVLGQIAGKKERWTVFDSFYWSFVTATTVGYGDLRPVNRTSRIIAIMGLTSPSSSSHWPCMRLPSRWPPMTPLPGSRDAVSPSPARPAPGRDRESQSASNVSIRRKPWLLFQKSSKTKRV